MSKEEKIKELIFAVLDEYEQSEQFKTRYYKFYQNTITQNIGSEDLRDLIENVELDSEDMIDEIEN